jgi:CRISPR/Cas system-associated exonuclease Cas4 (RecB family)
MKIVIDGRYTIDLDKKVGRVGVVDLICPLKGWLSFREPVKALVDVNEYIVAGKIEKAVEVDSECGRRRFRADAVCSDLVVEIKRRYNASLAPLYLWQLKAYMALLGIYKGAVVSLVDGYVKYVVVDEKEAEEVRRQLVESLNSVCKDEKPNRRVGKWCRWCKYSKECLNSRLI